MHLLLFVLFRKWVMISCLLLFWFPHNFIWSKSIRSNVHWLTLKSLYFTYFLSCRKIYKIIIINFCLLDIFHLITCLVPYIVIRKITINIFSICCRYSETCEEYRCFNSNHINSEFFKHGENCCPYKIVFMLAADGLSGRGKVPEQSAVTSYWWRDAARRALV